MKLHQCEVLESGWHLWNIFIDGWVEFLDVKLNKFSFLLEISVNHFKHESILFNWLTYNSQISVLWISLITFPSSFFVRLINHQDGFCPKYGLWYLIVIKAAVHAIHSMRSSRLMSLTMVFASKFIYVSNLET